MRGHQPACLVTAVLVTGFVAACAGDPAEPDPIDWETGATVEPTVPSTGEPPGSPPSTTTRPGTADPSTSPTSSPEPDPEPGNQKTGTCLEDNPNHIIGTPGDDELQGTAKDENICGMGGDDTIVGGGGEDVLYGGPGDDHIEGGPTTDFLIGNDGDDVLRGNNSDTKRDFLYGDTWLGANNVDDSGDDVLLGGTTSGGEDMDGGPGNDLLMPTPGANRMSVGGNSVNAGPGNDVVVTLDFSVGVFVDQVDLDGKHDVTLPIGGTGCDVKAQLDLSSDAGPEAKKWRVSCSLPWSRKLSGLDKVLPISASVCADGKVSMQMKLYNGLGKLSVSAQRDLVKAQASLGGDVCICDPLNASPAREELLLPRDYPG